MATRETPLLDARPQPLWLNLLDRTPVVLPSPADFGPFLIQAHPLDARFYQSSRPSDVWLALQALLLTTLTHRAGRYNARPVLVLVLAPCLLRLSRSLQGRRNRCERRFSASFQVRRLKDTTRAKQSSAILRHCRCGVSRIQRPLSKSTSSAAFPLPRKHYY